MNNNIVDDLAGKGWSVQENYFPADLIAELLRDLQQNREVMKQAGIGRGDHFKIQPDIRSDVTLWLTGRTGRRMNICACSTL